jgi:hypothetical protein
MKTKVCLILVVLVLGSGMLIAEDYMTRVYDLKWRSAREMAEILSGFDIRFEYSATFNTLTVQGTEPQHSVVSELLKKYDVAPRNIELRFYLLRASTEGEGIKNGLPENVRAVIDDIRDLTKYRSFELVDSPVMRLIEGRSAKVYGGGAVSYSVDLQRSQVIEDESGLRVRIDRFSLELAMTTAFSNGSMIYEAEKVRQALEKEDTRLPLQPLKTKAGLNTSFTIADGETLVLGASMLEGEGPAISRKDGEPRWAVVTVVTAVVEK